IFLFPIVDSKVTPPLLLAISAPLAFLGGKVYCFYVRNLLSFLLLKSFKYIFQKWSEIMNSLSLTI
ncbi:hypothetical protein ACVBOF_002467, partial [Listeria monocytogenes]